jgi:hypothetical protein
MVIAMQAVHCVSWEPLSGQDMGLVWRPQSMHNHKKVITSLFRESLCVRMRISSLVRTRDSTRSRVGLKSALCSSLSITHSRGKLRMLGLPRKWFSGWADVRTRCRTALGSVYTAVKRNAYGGDGPSPRMEKAEMRRCRRAPAVGYKELTRLSRELSAAPLPFVTSGSPLAWHDPRRTNSTARASRRRTRSIKIRVPLFIACLNSHGPPREQPGMN